MSSLRTVNRYFSLIFHYIQNATAVTTKKQKELSEYNAIYMIQDHLYLVYEAIQRDTPEVSKIFLRLFDLLQKNGQKSHRYEKKTAFDILGIVYQYTVSNPKQKNA
jgi:hypothetical protein